MADRSIDKREQYVDFATHCLQLAKVTTDRESRAILREMAAEWLKLAEVARQLNGSGLCRGCPATTLVPVVNI
jgi:hypothetical protein